MASTFGMRHLIGASCASFAGICTSMGVGRYVDTTVAHIPFEHNKERFDLTTFQGRYSKMLSNFDPSSLLSSNTDIRQAESLLERHKKGELSSEEREKLTDADLWSAQKLRDSAIHPQTNEIVPRPFRMAGYVPFNAPICVAMMASSSTPTLLFWNWVNQSQNALLNYFNGNKSATESDGSSDEEHKQNMRLLKSYGGAVGAALTVAFGVSQLIQRRFPKDQAARLLKFVSFPSSVVASCANAYIMRSPEIETGIPLMKSNGEVVNNELRSQRAAEKAVNETVLSRGILQIPVFFVPPTIMSLPPLAAASAASPVFGITAITFFTTASFGLGLPGTVAIFPQVGEVTEEEVEESFKQYAEEKPETQQKVLYYNKGL